MDVARHVLGRARAAGRPPPSGSPPPRAWTGCPRPVVEEKLAVLVEGARQARLYLAKEQFEI